MSTQQEQAVKAFVEAVTVSHNRGRGGFLQFGDVAFSMLRGVAAELAMNDGEKLLQTATRHPHQQATHPVHCSRQFLWHHR